MQKTLYFKVVKFLTLFQTGQVIGTTPKPTEGSVKTQLIAHDKEVFDIGFTRMASGREIFASVGGV